MELPELVTIVPPGTGPNVSSSWWIVDAFDELDHRAYPCEDTVPAPAQVCDTAKEAATIVAVHNRLASASVIKTYARCLLLVAEVLADQGGVLIRT